MRLLVFIAALVTLVALAGAGCGEVTLEISTPTPRRPTPTPSIFIPTPAPENVIVLEGSGSLSTQPFLIKSPAWELRWSFQWITGEKKLTAQVFPRGERLNPVASVESGPKPEEGFVASGSGQVQTGPGEYYLVVTAPGIDNWHIEIRQ